jgi:hypothetical protein
MNTKWALKHRMFLIKAELPDLHPTARKIIEYYLEASNKT